MAADEAQFRRRPKNLVVHYRQGGLCERAGGLRDRAGYVKGGCLLLAGNVRGAGACLRAAHQLAPYPRATSHHRMQGRGAGRAANAQAWLQTQEVVRHAAPSLCG